MSDISPCCLVQISKTNLQFFLFRSSKDIFIFTDFSAACGSMLSILVFEAFAALNLAEHKIAVYFVSRFSSFDIFFTFFFCLNVQFVVCRQMQNMAIVLRKKEQKKSRKRILWVVQRHWHYIRLHKKP